MAKMVAVEQLVPGDILSDAVLSMSGKVLLGKDIELTARHISLLNTWDIKNVFVDMLPEAEPAAVEPISAEQEMIGAGDVEYTMSKEYAMFAQQYDGIVTNTVQSFDIIRQQRIIPVAHLKNTAGGIYSSIDSNGLEMMNYLLAEDEQIADVISRHAVMVAYLSSIIARQLKWEEKDIVGVALASLLHDIGDLVTSDSKRQLHLAETAGLLKMAVGVPAEVILGIIQHRERVNGSGVPKGSKGEAIHPYAKVIAVADIFHNSAYSLRGSNPFPVLDQLTQEMYGKFDTGICQQFIARIKDSLLLNRIVLSDGRKAEIIFFNRSSYTLPVVRVGENEIIDLAKHPELSILQILAPTRS